MIAAVIISAWLGAAVPPLAEPVRSRRYIVIVRKRQKRTETSSAPRDEAIAVLRTGPDPDAPYYGSVATFEVRWRALHGY